MLRHITQKKFLPSIISDNYLKGSDNLRKRHKGYVSFEAYDPSCNRSILVNALADAKNVKQDEMVELFFDDKKMIDHGLNVSETFNDGLYDNKIEVTYHGVSEVDLKHVGDYRYVFGTVSLEFLTDDSRNEIFGKERIVGTNCAVSNIE